MMYIYEHDQDNIITLTSEFPSQFRALECHFKNLFLWLFFHRRCLLQKMTIPVAIFAFRYAVIHSYSNIVDFKKYDIFKISIYKFTC
jgi:hypothetical protein